MTKPIPLPLSLPPPPPPTKMAMTQAGDDYLTYPELKSNCLRMRPLAKLLETSAGPALRIRIFPEGPKVFTEPNLDRKVSPWRLKTNSRAPNADMASQRNVEKFGYMSSRRVILDKALLQYKYSPTRDLKAGRVTGWYFFPLRTRDCFLSVLSCHQLCCVILAQQTDQTDISTKTEKNVCTKTQLLLREFTPQITSAYWYTRFVATWPNLQFVRRPYADKLKMMYASFSCKLTQG